MELPPKAPPVSRVSSTDGLHPAVRDVLLAAAREAATARGPERRNAFRTSRYLLAACRVLGQPRAAIAALLGVRSEGIASRNAVEGNIPAVTFARLASISVDRIDEWQRRGLLPEPVVELSGTTTYPATALMAAYLRRGGNS